MDIQIRLGEPFWRTVGVRDMTVSLPEGSTLSVLLARLCADYPGLTGELAEAPPAILVGETTATPETVLTPAETVYILWAIAGG